MLISKKYNFIFIHIYKNAGTSITTALRPHTAPLWQNITSRALTLFSIPHAYSPQPYRAHITASEVKKKLGESAYDSFFSFAFVRNPWDWQVSLYKYMLKEKKHHQHELVKSFSSFKEYIKWRCENDLTLQKDFIFSKDDELIVDFVGRYEHLIDDFRKICARIGIQAELPRLNVSNETPYQMFYDNESKDLIARAFKPDIELFQYEF